MTTISTNRKKPSKAARLAAARIRNTEAELLDTITAQHKTILLQTEAMAKLSDAHTLEVTRLKMALAYRRSLEAHMREAIRDLLRFYDEGTKTTADLGRLLLIREIVK